MSNFSPPDPNNTPTVNPIVNFLCLLWLIPKREYLRRFRFGREVHEHVAGNDIVVLPDVFNPVIFRTGRYFGELLRRIELPATPGENSAPAMALDLCCGTGIQGLVLARRGFHVDAVDINPEAIRCTRMNIVRNDLESRMEAYFGDLFEPVQAKRYDVIAFHPPSFRGEPTSKFDLSWRSTDIFERFAEALPRALKSNGVAFVLQTSHGDEPGLLRALLNTGLEVEVYARKHFGVEIFSIYRLRHLHST